VLLSLPAWATASPGGALKKYEAGHYESAQWEYEQLLKNKPDEPRLHFNAGAAAFQRREYEAAAKHFNSALLTPDIKLQQQAYYNLGDAQYRFGEHAKEPQQKTEQWQSAVSSYESALKLNPQDADAKYNLEVVKKKLEELKKQQQQQKQQSQNQDQKDEDKDKKDKQDQSKQDQEKKDEQQKQQQQQQKDAQKDQQEQAKKEQEKQEQQKQEEQKQEQAKPEQSQQQQAQEQKDNPDEKQEGKPARAMAMSQLQALRLLDTLRSEEKPMIFVPPQKTNRQDRVLKDW
jgi:Ca-activated chloride channel family protein